jgi:Na+/proline symporter
LLPVFVKIVKGIIPRLLQSGFSSSWRKNITGRKGSGGMVFVWKLLVRPLGGVFDIYELLPAFLLSCLVIVIVSYLSPEEAKEIQDEFELARVTEI